jgi:mannan endo-1,6-alpha-mannosidase
MCLDSIKSVANTLANAIVSKYNETLESERIPGLFSDPYYFWEAGAVWGGLLDYAHLTGNTQNNDLIASALLFQIGEFNAFMPMNQSKTLGNDDQSYWGLAAMTAAETSLAMPSRDVGSWADLAANVFNAQTERWDTSLCGGGLKWQIFQFNQGYNYKNSISTANLFLLSARLAQFTGM